MKIRALTPLDVDHFPDVLEEGILYISEAFELAGHRCCCGCGEEVMTPLNPSRWRLYRDGTTVSLVPSIGNWKFACRSHYWIRNNQVIPSYDFTDDEVEEVVRDDRHARDRYLEQRNPRDSIGIRPSSSVPRWRKWVPYWLWRR